MTGINKYDNKDRRRQRRKMASSKGRNAIARDLATTKYRQQVMPDRKKRHIFVAEDSGEEYFFEERYYDDTTNTDT